MASSGLLTRLAAPFAGVARRLRRGADVRQLIRLGVIDLGYYSAQTGRTFASTRAAARHFVNSPASAGLSIHPLFEPSALPDWREHRVRAAVRYFAAPQQKASPHPLFDVAAAVAQLDAAGVATEGNPWLAWIRWAGEDTRVPLPSGSGELTWGALRAELLAAAVAWRRPAEALTEPTDRHGVSLLLPIIGGLHRAVEQVGLASTDADRQLVMINPTSRAQYACLRGFGLLAPVLVVRTTADTLADAWNRAAVAATGDTLIFLAPETRLDARAIDPLAAALTAEVAIAQPLNLQPDWTIHSAGAFFDGDACPSPLLVGHPDADALRLPVRPVPAAYSRAVAITAETFTALDGFAVGYANDLAEVDLSLRAQAADLGVTVLVPQARVTVGPRDAKRYLDTSAASASRLRQEHPTPPRVTEPIFAAAGFAVDGTRPDPVTGAPAPTLTRVQVTQAPPRLRWTIDTPVPAGPRAELWGDWHFARSLAAALESHGQQVAIDTRQARDRATRAYDDVLVCLRGTNAVRPGPAPVNLLWVLYDHAKTPVTAEEASGFDAVFAASISWAAERTASWGVPVTPLLQCTDTSLFFPERAGGPRNAHALFVGNTRKDGTSRPVVEAALHGSVPLDLYGSGWAERADAAASVVAERVANTELGRLYAEAGVVLNDHLPEMAVGGFLSNRLFDAAACGARVLSDEVAGIELFGGSVRCAVPTDIPALLDGDFADHWPGDDARLATATQIRAEHSFDHRAETLLQTALARLDDGGSSKP